MVDARRKKKERKREKKIGKIKKEGGKASCKMTKRGTEKCEKRKTGRIKRKIKAKKI